MNMKKTIAAVAASAMAVSAMATTVSAIGPLGYSLVANVAQTSSPKVTLQTTVTNIAAATTGSIIDLTNNTSKSVSVKTITLRVVDESTNATVGSYTYSNDSNATNYNRLFTGSQLTLTNEIPASGSTYSLYITINEAETSYTGVGDINNDIKNMDLEITCSDGNVTATVATNYAGAETSYEKRPLETGPNRNVNIAYYLQNNNCRTETSSYTNVLPVINDAIAANETVTFTFNTATQPVGWAKKTTQNSDGTWNHDSHGYGSKDAWATDIVYSNPGEGYNYALKDANGNANDVIAYYAPDWYGDSSYMSFTQHLYNGTSGVYASQAGWYGYAFGENYLGYNWDGQNLFGGALVINENLTMSLSDVDYFDWTNTSLSFDWDAILDGAATSNNYATYVQSIKLATSVRWYWDSMVIDIVEGEAEDVSSSAGVTGEEEELGGDDTLGGDEILGDETPSIDETPAVDETPAEVPAVQSPQTGNAPVALAVIPVALAAAAIVAKKRG